MSVRYFPYPELVIFDLVVIIGVLMLGAGIYLRWVRRSDERHVRDHVLTVVAIAAFAAAILTAMVLVESGGLAGTDYLYDLRLLLYGLYALGFGVVAEESTRRWQRIWGSDGKWRAVPFLVLLYSVFALLIMYYVLPNWFEGRIYTLHTLPDPDDLVVNGVEIDILLRKEVIRKQGWYLAVLPVSIIGFFALWKIFEYKAEKNPESTLWKARYAALLWVSLLFLYWLLMLSIGVDVLNSSLALWKEGWGFDFQIAEGFDLGAYFENFSWPDSQEWGEVLAQPVQIQPTLPEFKWPPDWWIF